MLIGKKMMKSKWFFHPRVNEKSELNLILFPFAGGNASVFIPWKRWMPQEWSVYPVLYPGRGTRGNDPLESDLRKMAKQFVEENRELFNHRFALFGHCTGIIVAYEVSKILKKEYGINPAFFISSCGASPEHRLFDQDIESMTDDQFLEMLIDTGRMSPEATKMDGFTEYYLPIMKNDFLMIDHYEPSEIEMIDCPVNVIISSDDELIRPEQIESWQAYTKAPVSVNTVSGGHYYYEKQPETAVELLKKIIH